MSNSTARLLHKRLAAADDKQAHIHRLDSFRYRQDRHLVQLHLRIVPSPVPGVGRVTPRAREVAVSEPEEAGAAARRHALALKRRAEDLRDYEVTRREPALRHDGFPARATSGSSIPLARNADARSTQLLHSPQGTSPSFWQDHVSSKGIPRLGAALDHLGFRHLTKRCPNLAIRVTSLSDQDVKRLEVAWLVIGSDPRAADGPDNDATSTEESRPTRSPAR